MRKHTPGPWFFSWDRKRLTAGPTGIWIADIQEGPLGHAAVANIDLIAAAPEMYEALKEMVTELVAATWADEGDDEQPALMRARAALAKAEGRG